jgi:hypothetical protein
MGLYDTIILFASDRIILKPLSSGEAINVPKNKIRINDDMQENFTTSIFIFCPKKYSHNSNYVNRTSEFNNEPVPIVTKFCGKIFIR